MLNPYLWIVVVGGFVCFLVACGNGANDLANAFGTSYGSRVLTLTQIVIIATCCEFAGAVGLGSNVATTMSSGIASLATFQDDPYVLMYGFLCTLGSTFIWLLLATWKDLPVSSHHAVAGGIIGFALVYGGADAVIWAGPKDEFPFVSGVVPIIVSWFISPLLAGIVSAIFYVAIRFLILQRENAVRIAPYTLPAVVLVTFFLEFLFIFMIAASSKLGWTVPHAAWMAAVVGAAAAVLSIGAIPVLKRRIRSMEKAAELRAEESGISVLEAMREILSGGRGVSHADKPDPSDASAGTGNAGPMQAAVAAMCDRQRAALEELGGASDSETHRLRHGRQQQQQFHHLGTTALASAAEAAGSLAIVSLPASPVAGGDSRRFTCGNGAQASGSPNAAAAAAKKLDAPPEADGAVVRDDDEEDDDDVSPPRHHSDANPHPRCGTNGIFSGSSSSAAEHNENNGNRNFAEEDVVDNAGGGGGGAATTEPKKRKGVKTMDKNGNPYVFVDGLRKATNGGYYDDNDVRIFDPRAEYMFRYLQVFTAACTSLAHGSNDVSNAIGPFSAIFDIYYYKEVRASAAVPLWVLALGGAGIVVGLATYGLNIMRLLGEKIALITPFRGFCAELATALVVALATTYSIPISSTHCITGAVITISMMDNGIKNVKWAIVLKMYAGWIMTLVIAAIMSACFFTQGINSPVPSHK